MADAVQMGSWVELDDITLKYMVSTTDETVEFSFGHGSTFTLSLSERALARCVDLFPMALLRLRTELAEAEE